ncbi:site-specific integrase [Roseomonas sp. GCM10028921]
MFERAFRANDADLAQEAIQRFEGEEGLELGPTVRPIILRYALRVLAEVERDRARREMGEYPPAAVDPVMSLLATGPATIQPSQEVRSDEVRPQAPVVSPGAPKQDELRPDGPVQPALVGRRVSEVVREKVAALEAKPDDERSGKLIRDWIVAGRLFVELCGGLGLHEVTEEVASEFVRLAARVPALHGKPGELRGITALEAIRRADEVDAAALRDTVHLGVEPEEAPRVARLSVATINKHLTSLQSMLGGVLPRDAEGKSALVAARYSKKAVRRGATFDRQQLSDDRLRKIFHGPVFTGFGDAEGDRFVPGETLILDARYWVPLIGLFSGAREEELLELWAGDFGIEDGVEYFQIGAVHEGRRVGTKNEASIRKVPVHSTLKRLGLMRFVHDAQARGVRRLFLGFSRVGPDNRYGHDFSQWWTEYRRRVGSYARGQDFHSMRHGVNTRLLKRGAPETIIRDILGHSQGNSMTGKVYNSGMTLDVIAANLEKLDYPALDVDLLITRAKASLRAE